MKQEAADVGRRRDDAAGGARRRPTGVRGHRVRRGLGSWCSCAVYGPRSIYPQIVFIFRFIILLDIVGNISFNVHCVTCSPRQPYTYQMACFVIDLILIMSIIPVNISC